MLSARTRPGLKDSSRSQQQNRRKHLFLKRFTEEPEERARLSSSPDLAQEKCSMGDGAERVRVQGGLRILTLEGSGYEMGRQHGEALRE